MVELTGKEKAAIFLSMIGKETAGRLLQYLPTEEAQAAAEQLANLSEPDPQNIEAVMHDFESFMALPPADKNEEKEEIPEKELTPLERIARLDPEVFFDRISIERPEVMAFILKQLPDSFVADVLLLMGEDRDRVSVLMESLREESMANEFKDKIIDLLLEKD